VPPMNVQLMTTIARTRFDQASGPAPRIRLAAHRAVDYGALLEPLCKAIGAAHDLWRMQAFFRGVSIQGAVAIGGTLEGPELEPLLTTQLKITLGPKATQEPLPTIAGAIGEAWRLFQLSVRVPGLPWYPSFVAVPGPQAPPTPNVPTPLGACTYNAGAWSATSLTSGMKRRLPTASAAVARLFDAVAHAFETVATQWVLSQPVTNVLGKGPVPTFSPPYVPTGHVMGGDNVPTPGHLAV
jgi:hypothetical protein